MPLSALVAAVGLGFAGGAIGGTAGAVATRCRAEKDDMRDAGLSGGCLGAVTATAATGIGCGPVVATAAATGAGAFWGREIGMAPILPSEAFAPSCEVTPRARPERSTMLV
eukprot:Sspe_Gene.46940::Locus_23633_Transcript_1_1_Confidence_1.000_Length_398::g.46940::m.46940